MHELIIYNHIISTLTVKEMYPIWMF